MAHNVGITASFERCLP